MTDEKVYYHGSRMYLKKIERQWATHTPGSKPEEALDCIYVTKYWDLALFFAARPNGGTTVNYKEKTVKFQHPENFNGEKDAYIYSIDISAVPPDKIIPIDDLQIALDIDAIDPIKIEKYNARKIWNYFTLLKN